MLKFKENYKVRENMKIGLIILKVWSPGTCEVTFVPLLLVLRGDYAWKHKCYRWKKNASVFLDVRLRS
jgi:hypothetical protein